MVKVKIKKLHPDAVIPQYASEGASGFDLVAVEDVEVWPGETVKVRTGLAFEIPEGYELQIRPRSGISTKTKIRIPNSPGTVDADYRGEVLVLIENTTDETTNALFQIRKGDRIAQGVIVPVVRAEFEEVEELSETKRGSGGFGSTGVR